MAYLLDANVFIQAKNRHYGRDFCPAFWDWLTASHAAGEVFSIARVRDEIGAGTDDLTAWAADQPSTFFLEPDSAMLAALGRVSAWADSHGYEPAAVATFLAGADCYLVSHALARSYTVVTEEVAADTTRRIKIPNACTAFGIRPIAAFQMLREAGARFVLA